MNRQTDVQIANLHKNMFDVCVDRHRMQAEIYKNWERYRLKEYPVVYQRYMGTGCHLYVFTKTDEHDTKINEVCDQRKLHPRHMMSQLTGIDCRLAMVDVEMGGMGVWLSEDTNGSDSNI